MRQSPECPRRDRSGSCSACGRMRVPGWHRDGQSQRSEGLRLGLTADHRRRPIAKRLPAVRTCIAPSKGEGLSRDRPLALAASRRAPTCSAHPANERRGFISRGCALSCWQAWTRRGKQPERLPACSGWLRASGTWNRQIRVIPRWSTRPQANEGTFHSVSALASPARARRDRPRDRTSESAREG